MIQGLGVDVLNGCGFVVLKHYCFVVGRKDLVEFGDGLGILQEVDQNSSVEDVTLLGLHDLLARSEEILGLEIVVEDFGLVFGFVLDHVGFQGKETE